MNKNNLEFDQEQIEYDKSTDHGHNMRQPRIWSQKIETELKALEKFAGKKDVFKINMK